MLARKSLWRCWLISLAAPCSQGCIVADPPQYQDPKRSPPILDLEQARPFIGSIIVRSPLANTPERPLEVKVPVRSDDQGEGLKAMLYLDYFTVLDGLASHHRVLQNIPASTLDDTGRSVSLEWAIGPNDFITPGCHQLSLIVTHDSSFDENTARPKKAVSQGDTAFATWWMNVDPLPLSDPYTLVDCPQPTNTSP